MRAETLNSQEVLLPTWARKAATSYKLQPKEFAVRGGTETIRLVVIRSGDERKVVPEMECVGSKFTYMGHAVQSKKSSPNEGLIKYSSFGPFVYQFDYLILGPSKDQAHH